MNRSTRLLPLLLLLIALLITGCVTTHYEFHPPITESGRLCITQCASIKETCHGNETRRASSEKNTCERSNDTFFAACASRSTTREQIKECEKQKKYCWSSPDTDRCDSEHRTCFVNCGGSIREYEE